MSGAEAAVRVGIYTRVSTADQVEGTSLATQLERCRAYSSGMGWTVGGEFVDEGVSGAKASRPALDRLMGDIRAGCLQAMVVFKLDRVGRSVLNVSALMAELDDLGVALVSVSEGFDSASPAGRLMRNVLASMAEFEREVILERTLGGTEAAAREGRWLGGPPPFGYRKVGTGRGARLEIDPAEAKVVRRAWQLMVVERRTTTETAQALNREDLLPRKAKRWTSQLVRGFLREAIGLSGTWVYRRPSRRGRHAPIEMAIPAVLDPVEHEALRLRLASTSTVRRRSNPYLLSGVIISPCGANMQGITNGYGTRLYRCANSWWHAEQHCDCRTARADVVEQAVWATLKTILAGPGRTGRIATAARPAAGGTATVSTQDLAAIERKVKRLERAAGDSLAAALAAGVDPHVAAEAATELSGQLLTARAQRERVASWLAQNVTTARRTTAIGSLTKGIEDVLASPDPATARRVVDLLGIQVKVTGWRACHHCAGKGLVAVKQPGERQRVPGRTANVCPHCHRHRHIAIITITGVLPLGEAVAFKADVDPRTA